MTAEILISFAAQMMAICLATERLVTYLKTLFPQFLGEERKDGFGQADAVADRWRKFLVQMIALAAAWFTAAMLAEGGFHPFGEMAFKFPGGEWDLPVGIVALLASGGSTFWSQILGYARAVKDVRAYDAEERRMDPSRSLTPRKSTQAVPGVAH